MPENRYGSAAPATAPASTIGCIILRTRSVPASLNEYRYEIISAMAARAPDPIANPFPIAAVVLPTASSVSVIRRTSGSRPLISAMPPALSEIGPYVSTETVAVTNDSIPIADIAMPYIPQTA